MARRDCRCTACPNSRSSISKHGARGHWLGWPVQNLSSADTLLLGISGDRGVGCTSIPYPPAPPPPRQGRLRLGVKCTSLHMYQAKCAAYCDTWAEHRPQTANQGCRSPNPRFPILHFCPISQTCPGFSRLNGFFFFSLPSNRRCTHLLADPGASTLGCSGRLKLAVLELPKTARLVLLTSQGFTRTTTSLVFRHGY